MVLHNIDTKIGVKFNTIYITFDTVVVISNINWTKFNTVGVEINTNFGIYIVKHHGVLNLTPPFLQCIRGKGSNDESGPTYVHFHQTSVQRSI